MTQCYRITEVCMILALDLRGKKFEFGMDHSRPPDPDPYQNVKDPEDSLEVTITLNVLFTEFNGQNR
jgi:hypothetical protein